MVNAAHAARRRRRCTMSPQSLMPAQSLLGSADATNHPISTSRESSPTGAQLAAEMMTPPVPRETHRIASIRALNLSWVSRVLPRRRPRRLRTRQHMGADVIRACMPARALRATSRAAIGIPAAARQSSPPIRRGASIVPSVRVLAAERGTPFGGKVRRRTTT